MTQTLYIHIGMPKTGTTSLQFFMHRNKATLKKQDVYYPATMRDPLPTATQHRYVNEFMRQQQRNRDEGKPVSGHVINRVAQEIERQGFAKNVISEELFSYDPEFSAAYLGRFAKKLDAKVVVFLRRQDTWAESMYAQSVRGGYTGTFEEFIQARSTVDRLDFVKFLGHWAKHFGAENVIVRPYVDRQTQTHEEMLKILDVPLFESVVAEKRNPSLSGEAMEFIRGFGSLSRNNYPKFNRIFAAQLTGMTVKGSPTFFTPEARAAYMDGYKAINDEVVKTYLGQDAATDPLFNIDPATFPSEDKVVKPMAPERRLEILQALCAGEDGSRAVNDDEGQPVEARIGLLEKQIDDLCSESQVAV